MKAMIPTERIEKCIYLIRGYKVMTDNDLAELYGVKVSALNQAVKRNKERFPADFLIQLTKEEYEFLRSQTVILKSGRGSHRKYLPFAFTEQGVAMLSSVLKSRRAALVNVQIMRTFVQLREMLISNRELARKFAALERKYDSQFKAVFDAIRAMMLPPTKNQRLIGFGRE